MRVGALAVGDDEDEEKIAEGGAKLHACGEIKALKG